MSGYLLIQPNLPYCSPRPVRADGIIRMTTTELSNSDVPLFFFFFTTKVSGSLSPNKLALMKRLELITDSEQPFNSTMPFSRSI